MQTNWILPRTKADGHCPNRGMFQLVIYRHIQNLQTQRYPVQRLVSSTSFPGFSQSLGAFVKQGGFRCLAALLLCLLLMPVPGLAQISLPDIGDPESAMLSPAQEQQLGRVLLRQVRSGLPLSADPKILSYVESVGLRLVSSAADGHGEFTFLVVQDPNINAFAMPGGIIGVNTGLIDATRNEAELAAVIAHEIAHVTQRHIARAYSEGSRIDLATGLAILAGIIASAYSPEVGQAAIIGGMAGGTQAGINFTRSNEQEADRIGIGILVSAEYNPQAMPGVFERMMQLAGPVGESVPEYLRTHPVTANRISDSRVRADQYPASNYRDDSQEFRLIQARVKALADPGRVIENYRGMDVEDRLPEHTYGYAVALVQRNQPALALSSLKSLDVTESASLGLYVNLATAEALLAGSGQDAVKALEILSELNNVYPRHLPVTQTYAVALIRNGDNMRAIRLIDDAMAHRPLAPELLRLKAEAASKASLQALSHETMAEYHFHHARYGESAMFLNRALTMSDLTPNQEERIRHKLEIANSFAEDAE